MSFSSAARLRSTTAEGYKTGFQLMHWRMPEETFGTVTEPLVWTLSILCLSIGAICLIVFFLTTNTKHQVTGGNITDVLRLLRDAPVLRCPDVQNGWRIEDSLSGQVVWAYGKRNAESLFSSFSKIDVSAQAIWKVISSTSEYRPWDADFFFTDQISRVQSTKPNANLQRRDASSNYDVIITPTSFIPGHFIRRFCSIGKWLFGNEIICRRKVIQRCWQKDGPGCHWLLEYEECLQEWILYLVQTLDDWLGSDKCILTLICHPHCRRGVSAPNLVARKMVTLQQYLLSQTLQSMPEPQFVPYQKHVPKQRCKDESSEDEISVSSCDEANDFVSESLGSESEPNILERFRKIVEEKKQRFEQERRKKQGAAPVTSPKTEKAMTILCHNYTANTNTIDTGKEETSNNAESKRIEETSQKDSQQSPPMLNNDDTLLTRHLHDSSTEIIDKKEVESLNCRESYSSTESCSNQIQEKSSMKVGLRKLFSSTLSLSKLDIGDAKSSEARDSDVKVITSDDISPNDCSEPNENAQSPMDGEKHCTQMSTPDYESLAEKARECVKGLLYIRDAINKLDITLGHEDQARQSGGWIYCGLVKDTVVLRKISNNTEGTNVHSYLGKGVIDCDPQQVFQTLSQPRTRFAYDETLKVVDVKYDWKNGTKIVHFSHDINQLFKRESRDFCVLHSEKSIKDRYLIAMHSVNWPDCPPRHNVSRGKMCFSDGESSSSAEELASNQPYCVAALRDYVMSSQAISSKVQKCQPSVTAPPQSSNQNHPDRSKQKDEATFSTQITC